MTLAAVDYLILILYFAFVLSIGWRLRKKVSTSGDFLSHSSYRVTGSAVAMGQAAGVTAADAAMSSRLPREVPWSDVTTILTKQQFEPVLKG